VSAAHVRKIKVDKVIAKYLYFNSGKVHQLYFQPNQALKLTVASRVQLTWLSIGLVQMIKLSL
jgi:hypothetical protein